MGIKRIFVLDFDGTMTDAEVEGKPYVEACIRDLVILTGRKAEEIQSAVVEAEAAIAADPENNGWLYDGKIVAPAAVDPYLRMRAIAGKVLNQSGLFLKPTDREPTFGYGSFFCYCRFIVIALYS